MSCGDPHATPCSEVDAHLDEYLDRELSAEDIAMLEQHFRECPPCRAQLRLALMMQKLVARSCGCRAPQHLRARVLKRITEVRSSRGSFTIEETHILPE
jgi:anti-sigma factor (TIGR02949 family)